MKKSILLFLLILFFISAYAQKNAKSLSSFHLGNKEALPSAKGANKLKSSLSFGFFIGANNLTGNKYVGNSSLLWGVDFLVEKNRWGIGYCGSGTSAFKIVKDFKMLDFNATTKYKINIGSFSLPILYRFTLGQNRSLKVYVAPTFNSFRISEDNRNFNKDSRYYDRFSISSGLIFDRNFYKPSLPNDETKIIAVEKVMRTRLNFNPIFFKKENSAINATLISLCIGFDFSLRSNKK